MMRTAVITLIVLLLANAQLTGQVRIDQPPNLWNSQDKRLLLSPEKPERTFLGKAGIASLEVFTMEAFTTTIMILLPRSITNWQERYWLYFGQTFRKAWTQPPVWDHDPWPVNYIGHPLQGAVFFNSLRSQKCSFAASAGFTLFHTFLWEYGIEAIMERPSIQDLIINPLVGIPLGEWFHHLTKKMHRGGFTPAEKILVTLINPTYVVNNGYQ